MTAVASTGSASKDVLNAVNHCNERTSRKAGDDASSEVRDLGPPFPAKTNSASASSDPAKKRARTAAEDVPAAEAEAEDRR